MTDHFIGNNEKSKNFTSASLICKLRERPEIHNWIGDKFLIVESRW